MKFGKRTDLAGIDLSLPPDPASNARLLRQLSPGEGPSRVYIGGTGWSMPEWVGKVYPAGTRSRDYLREYSRQFNTIELNTTHYRIPTPALIEKWKRESTPDFKFCPKVPQSISHSQSLGLGTALVPEFCQAVQALEEKLGCCFLQLPPYFDFERLGALERFLTAWPKHLPLAVEFRHESWFDDPGRSGEIFGLLTGKGISSVITDVAGRRDVLHMRLTTACTVIRFVGNGLHPSDYRRIDEWTDRLQQWIDAGLQEVYFFTHEPDNVLAPELAAYLLANLKGFSDIATRGPHWTEGNAGEQMSLF